MEIEELALFDVRLPAFDGAAIEGRNALIEGQDVAPEVKAEWERIGEMVDHLLGFDIWLFSVPMWNFGIPYPLKHYVDLVTQPRLAFGVDAAGNVEGMAAGRTAIIIASGALDIRPDNALEALDHQITYLAAWLNFIGVTDIRTVRIKPTFGDPAMVDPVMEAAYAEADAVARDLSRPERV
ncbi:FMN-dependent NADH-azoreductase 2 [Sphingomonas sp. DBB INV C78]